jgi:hypothetical protein
MFKRRSQILTASFLVCDLFMIALAWCGAYFLRFDAGWIRVTKATPDLSLCWANLPLVLLLASVSFHFTGQYAIDRLRRLREEVVGVLKGVTLLTLLVLASTFFRRDPYESRGVMALFWAASLAKRRVPYAKPAGWGLKTSVLSMIEPGRCAATSIFSAASPSSRN